MPMHCDNDGDDFSIVGIGGDERKLSENIRALMIIMMMMFSTRNGLAVNGH